MDSSTHSTTVQSSLADARENALLKIKFSIVNKAGTLLPKPHSSSLFQQLGDILSKAADITMKLSTQRNGLLVQSMMDLPNTYDPNAETMELHILHHRDTAENENCFNGQKILMVTQPAVIAVGSSDGNDYSVRRVLKKAIVWMGQPDRRLIEYGGEPNEKCENAIKIKEEPA